jgi:hypothetical protein
MGRSATLYPVAPTCLFSPFPTGRLAPLDQEQGTDCGDLHRVHRDLPGPGRHAGRVRGLRRHCEQEDVGEVPDPGGQGGGAAGQAALAPRLREGPVSQVAVGP